MIQLPSTILLSPSLKVHTDSVSLPLPGVDNLWNQIDGGEGPEVPQSTERVDSNYFLVVASREFREDQNDVLLTCASL